MRTWIQSACLVLAVGLVPVSLVAAGGQGPVHPAQASTRTGRHIERPPGAALTSNVRTVAAAAAAAAAPARYTVQPGDTLSGIAARFAVPGGWPAVYAASRPRIGPDPDLLHAGTVLVLPGVTGPARYTVAAGDTLAAIAAGLRVPGGWPALYHANRQVIGPSPDTIHPGTVLAVPHPAAPAPSAPVTGGQQPQPAPPVPSAPASPGHQPRPAAKPAPTTTGMPAWLTLLLLAVGLLTGLAFLAEAALAIRHRRQQAALACAVQRRRAETDAGPDTASPGSAGTSAAGTGAARPGSPRSGAEQAHIVLADHERVVVTRNKRDDTICVLRPPGEDPMAILRVARLVLPEGPYGELAEQLKVPARWPMT
jgi:LysM repeat protein